MTVKALITCDYCGRSAEDDAGWGVVNVIRPSRPSRDVCPGCIAKLGGWRNGHGVGGHLERHA